jgi:ubiquinone/menaquinone biosynthesis C-methylase UbiE
MTDISFQEGNVLALDFPDNSFDIVFSNGVLHHTLDWTRGIAELVRVLKPGGLGWLYVIENPGGLFWDSIEILRVITHGENRASARAALRLIGVPGNRIFYMLDHVMVPINVRLTPQQIEQSLELAGATDVRRLERGVDFDRVERIHQGEPYAEDKFGVGENRYVFSKA